jgi:hypothetical protein
MRCTLNGACGREEVAEDLEVGYVVGDGGQRVWGAAPVCLGKGGNVNQGWKEEMRKGKEEMGRGNEGVESNQIK